jgi:hypothetical protein
LLSFNRAETVLIAAYDDVFSLSTNIKGNTMNTTAQRGASDFDFLIGRWRVRHTWLRQRLAGCDDWLHFEGTMAASTLLGGAANVDDNVLAHPDGLYRAATLRAFDPAKGTWSIWWLDGRHPARLDVPMVGAFENGVGTFYADDSFQGRPIRVRFLWSAPAGGTPRWEQAFSGDGGKHWETNWVMEFIPESMESCIG